MTTTTMNAAAAEIGILGRVAGFFALLMSANAAAAAVEAGVTPRKSDLDRLGIDAAALNNVRRA